MMLHRFREDFENKSIEELVEEQQFLMREIIKFENKYILKKDIDVSLQNPS